jgi:hypothetical protein
MTELPTLSILHASCILVNSHNTVGFSSSIMNGGWDVDASKADSIAGS